MKHIEYFDPFPDLPPLERHIIKLRSYEMTLALYYAEEIGRLVLDMVNSHDRWKVKSDPTFSHRAPPGAKRRMEKALAAMVEDDAISSDEKKLILGVRNFRNDIAHEADRMFADLEMTQFSGFKPDRETRLYLGMKEYDHTALRKFSQAFAILERAQLSTYRSGTIEIRGPWLFSTTERAIKKEIERTRARLKQLSRKRMGDIACLNKELTTGSELLSDLMQSSYFSLRFERGRMTDRGVEFCYRLFDLGLSNLAIAHLFEMKILAIASRKRCWEKAGGNKRPSVVFDEIPIKIVRSVYDD